MSITSQYLVLLSCCCLMSCLCSAQQAVVKPAAYYYPWHSNNFHNNEGYLRETIGHQPKLGEYNDRNPEVIKQHMSWSQEANIQVWITSWWGVGSLSDITMQSTVLPTIKGSTLEFAILYETLKFVGKDDVVVKKPQNIIDSINHICDNFVQHPNYYHIDGRPVLVVYLTRRLERNGIFAEVILLMRTAAAKKGYNFFIVGDHTFGNAPRMNEQYSAFDYLDAVTNYDVYGSLGQFMYSSPDALANHYQQKQLQWKQAATNQNCAFIPGVTPGFNDRGVRLPVNHEPLSRKLGNETAEFGSFFEASLQHAIPLVDSKADSLMIITSFNEWHEDTQIEPAIGVTATGPFDYTKGLEYEGYDLRYLDILNEMTGGIPPTTARPTTAVPTTVNPTTAVPTTSLPTHPTTANPTPAIIPTTSLPTQKNCIECTDVGNKWMQDQNAPCHPDHILIQRKCNRNEIWKREKSCQYTCYITGHGYVGDVCCLPEESV